MSDPRTRVQEHLSRHNWGFLSHQGYVLGLDLGGYGVRLALVDLEHHTCHTAHIDIEQRHPQHVLDASKALMHSFLHNQGVTPDRLIRIAVGFGGPINPLDGRIRLSPRMPDWEGFSLKEYYEQAFDTSTIVENNANLIALAEATFGIGQGCAHLFYLHLSSGVGGGMVLDGRLYQGSTAAAGEIGHAVVSHHLDQTPAMATLEQLVSVNALLRRAEMLGLTTNDLNDLFTDHAAGQQVIHEAVDVLGLRLAQVIALLDPQMVVLGGIVVRIGGEPFVQALSAQVGRYMRAPFTKPVPIAASVLGVESIAIGAVALALLSLQA
ncbi:MAG: ROK family protein [Chloroflexaceae bacterium]|nr:ROK family protein [Chloroflexaceae bacterium]